MFWCFSKTCEVVWLTFLDDRWPISSIVHPHSNPETWKSVRHSVVIHYILTRISIRFYVMTNQICSRCSLPKYTQLSLRYTGGLHWISIYVLFMTSYACMRVCAQLHRQRTKKGPARMHAFAELNRQRTKRGQQAYAHARNYIGSEQKEASVRYQESPSDLSTSYRDSIY